jgi:solute carrier family 31 (copper transporter), member 1
MNSMNMGGSSSMNMTVENGMMMAQDMGMVFYNSHSTPLYSMSWMPSGPAGYAGTCIFLIFLAITFRLLLVTRHMLEARWRDQAYRRRYITVEGKQPLSERVLRDPESKTGIISVNGVEENVRVINAPSSSGVQPWRFSVDLPRSILVTVIGGVGYLLMLAVMTLNIGYFLSVLAGYFVGELAVGRFGHVVDEHTH